MDHRARLFVKQAEATVEAMGRKLGIAQAKIAELEQKLATSQNLKADTQSAHQEDIVEILEYQQENARLLETLQTIADGKGKYAKIARDAIRGM